MDNSDKNEILQKIEESSKKTDQSILELTEKTDEILEAIGHFSDKTEERLKEIESKMVTMVTKDYLDEKLADLKGDLTVLMRKEDRKLLTLVNILEIRKVITPEDVNTVLSLEPFAQVR